ncbi:MAG: hypothetical protein U1E33_08685 [Rhodospirillales bacterium]
MFKVFFDHSVRQDAVVAEDGYVFADGKILGHCYQYLKPHRADRPLRSDWKQQEISALTNIARLIYEEHIIAYSSVELENEGFQVETIGGHSPVDIFHGCIFREAAAPLERSKWGLPLDTVMSKQAVIDYCKCFFLSPNPSRIEQFIDGMRRNSRYSLTEYEEKCLRNAHVFKDICHGISENHYPDALHLWTAEENSLDVFLTHDKKFKNVVERQKVKLHCRVMFPTQLLNELQSGIKF